MNGVWLDLSDIPEPEQYHRKWVLVEGTFDAIQKGHLGAFHGVIRGITRIQFWHEHSESNP